MYCSVILKFDSVALAALYKKKKLLNYYIERKMESIFKINFYLSFICLNLFFVVPLFGQVGGYVDNFSVTQGD